MVAGLDAVGLGAVWLIGVPVLSGLEPPVAEVVAETAGGAT
jgi:hypothetical protein